MKRRYQVASILLIISIGLWGCNQEGQSDKDTTQIVWQTERNLKKNENYFNQLLEEKKLPYELQFVSEDDKDKAVVDICDTGWQIYTKSYDTREDILDGKFLELDAYLDSDEGAVIQNSLPQKVWDTYKVNGKQYTLPSVRYIPFESVYIWNTELANQYDIHPENWDGDLGKYEESLLKVVEGEQGQVIPVANLFGYLERNTDLTNVLGFYYPIVIRESDEEIKAELLYETPEYQERLKTIQKFYEKGLYKPEDEYEEKKEVFLEINTQFISENALESYGLKSFFENHDWKKIGQEKLFELTCGAQEIGITSESKNPKKAFEFLCHLYEDVDLTNALMWGKEGTDYVVIGNRVEGLYKEPLFGEGVGNALIGYAGVGEDEKKKDVYMEQYEKVTLSKINGFFFTGKDCQKELDAILQISLELDRLDSQKADMILHKQDEIIQKYKDAGIEKVINEWNRQYQEWKD